MRRHEVGRLAAAYLGEELPRRARRRYEDHLLSCDACWHEVQAARRGRTLAESLREVAAPHLRERIRAVPAAAPPRPRRRPFMAWQVAALAAAIIAVLLGLVVWQGQPRQPPPIAAAVAAYQSGTSGTPVAEPPPIPAIDALRWSGSEHHDLAGMPVTAYRYSDAAGHRLLLIRSARPIPTANGAQNLVSGRMTWLATVDNAILLCADQPRVSWLAIGADRGQVLAAGHGLGLLR